MCRTLSMWVIVSLLCMSSTKKHITLIKRLNKAQNGYHSEIMSPRGEDTHGYLHLSARSHVIPIPWTRRIWARRRQLRGFPLCNGGALASDFSSSRWKGVTASEDGRRDATINRELTRRRRADPLSFRAFLLFLLSFYLSLFLSLFSLVTAGRPSFRKPRGLLSSSREANSWPTREATLIILQPPGFYGTIVDPSLT